MIHCHSGSSRLIELEEGWQQLADGLLAKLVRWAETGAPGTRGFSADCNEEEYMTAVVTAYNMMTQKPPHNYSAALYDRAHGFIRDYLDAAFGALSAGGGYALFGQRRVPVLSAEAAVGRLQGYPEVVKTVKNIFSYLDRFYTRRGNLPRLVDSLNALVRERLQFGGGDDLERHILDAVATPLGEDLQGNPCSMRRYGVVQMLTCTNIDLDEAPQPPKDTLMEAIRRARQHRSVAAAWPDPSVGLAGARFGGAAGLLAQANDVLRSINAGNGHLSIWQSHLKPDVAALTRAAHCAQRRLRIAAMPRAVTHGLYTEDGELAAHIRDLMAVAYHRPKQLLLLGALVSRGEDSASPLVGAPLVLLADVASKIREALHQMPGLCPRATSPMFAWHDDDAHKVQAAKRPRADAGR